MRFFRWLLLILVCSLLLSCVSTRMAQDFQLGKKEFAEGHYKQAFRQMLPLAAAGNPVAQYAVGYMYYYGYGVPIDCESGMFWMSRAAQRHYLPAVKAIQLIQQRPPEREVIVKPAPRVAYARDEELQLAPVSYRRPLSKNQPPPPIPDAHDEVLQSVPVSERHPLPKNQPPPPIVTPTPAPVVIRTTPMVEAKPVNVSGNHYALQLFGAYQLADVKNVQKELQIETARVFHTEHQGKDWYVLTVGQYPTATAARSARQNLPEGAQSLHPWVRDLAGLGKMAV